MWRWLLSILTWLSADPAAIDAEPARAAAAVSAARASMLVDAPAPPAPSPKPGPTKCCVECGGRGYVVMPDGHRVSCPCPTTCVCKSKAEAPCPDGKCPPKTVLR